MLNIIVDKKETNYSYSINAEDIRAVELSHNKKNNKIVIEITIKDNNKDNHRIHINSENYKNEDIKNLIYELNKMNLKRDFATIPFASNKLILNTIIFEDKKIIVETLLMEEGGEEEE